MTTKPTMVARTVAVALAAGVLFGFALHRAPAAIYQGVYSDATAWWHFDYDPNSNGLVETAEIKDQLRFSGGTGGYPATSLVNTPSWNTSIPSTGPAGGQSYGGAGLLLQPTAVAPEGFAVSNLALAGDSAMVTRFHWDGYTDPTSSYAWYYKNAYGGGGAGWMAGFQRSSSKFGLLIAGKGFFAPSWTDWDTSAGAWYDLAVVVDDNGSSDTITFYRWKNGSSFQSQTLNVTDAINGTVYGGTLVGLESATGGNAIKSFKGTIDHIAVWNRTLSGAEVHDAFGSPNPAWSIGVGNDLRYEMQHEGQVPDMTYAIGDPWHEMSRAVVGSRPTATVTFNLTAEQAALNQVYHLDVDEFGGGGTGLVSINGQTLGAIGTAGGSNYTWLVPAGVLNTGQNSVAISLTGGTNVVWDWMEMGGAWQLGTDNNSYGEFAGEWLAPADFYVTDPNLMHARRAITSTRSDISLHFNLSDELAALESGYVYTTEVTRDNTPADVDVSVNGLLLGTIPAGTPNHTVFDFRIWPSMLQPGDNVVNLHFLGTSSYVGFDFHRFQAAVPEPASAVMLGLGLLVLGGAAGRRSRRRVAR